MKIIPYYLNQTLRMLWVLIAATGIASLFVDTPSIYSLIKLLGAGYLFYLGFEMIRHTIRATEVDIEYYKKSNEMKKMSYKKIFLQATIVELSNLKMILFF